MYVSTTAGSHIPIISKIIGIINPTKVLETGLGFNSTGFFIKNGIETTSLEISKEYGKNPLFKPYLFLDPDKAIKFIDSSESFDFIFVDGHIDRWRQINASFTHTNLIITHDTECMVYEWKKTILPKGWVWVDIIEHRPWTSIITNDIDRVKDVLSFKHKIYDGVIGKDYLNRDVR